MLELEDVHVRYGNVPALRGISLRVAEGEFVALIGANGAGKSTTLRAISGLARPQSGSIRYRGREIAGLPPERLVRMGITHVPEGRRIFSNLTVGENLDLGAYVRDNGRGVLEDCEMVLGLFPRLRERYRQVAGSLSGGEQQMLAIARALMARPTMLLLDEPSLGIAPILVQGILDAVDGLRRRTGIGVLLVEQNAHLALRLSHRAYVLETGRVALETDSKGMLSTEHIARHYLGATRKPRMEP